MTAPKLTLNVLDGGLGSAQNTDRLVACFGISSAGTVGTMAQFTDPAALVAAYGYGPGISLAIHVMETSGQPVIFGRASQGEASAVSVVTHTGSGSSVMTVGKTSGALEYFDGYSVLVKIVTSGTVGTDICRASVSLDNGVTSLGTYVIQPATQTIVLPNTNITLTFSAASVVAGDSYTFSSTAPRSTGTGSAAGDITALIDGLQAYAATHSGIYPSLVIDADWRDAAAVGAIQAKMDNAAAGYEYARCVTSAEPVPDGYTTLEWIQEIEADFADTNAIRVSVCAGQAKVLDGVTGAYLWRSVTWPMASRLAATEVHIDPAWVSLGSCPRVIAITHDERVRSGLPGLDDARFSTMTTLVGRTGFYITNGRLMAPPGSDYVYTQYGRVMDKVCKITYAYFILTLSQSVRLAPATGFILEADAQKLEAGCNGRLKANILAPGNASAALCTVSRTDNLSVPGAPFHAQVRVVPLGYLKDIQIDLFYTATLS